MIPWKRTLSAHPSIQILPYMFDDIHIRATGRPIQHIELFAFEPVTCQPRSVLRVVVLLKVYVLFVDFKVLQGAKDIIIED
jgi:hypothetical protein